MKSRINPAQLKKVNKMRLIDVRQLSDFLAVKPKTIYDWVHKKKIPYYKLEGSLRFDVEEVKVWLKKRKHKVFLGVDVP